MVIQQLLHDAGATQLDLDLVDVEPRGLEVAADWRTLRTPESYLGYRQANAFAQEDVARFDEPAVYRDRAGCRSTRGASAARGRSPATPPSRTSRATGSTSGSRRAMSTS